MSKIIEDFAMTAELPGDSHVSNGIRILSIVISVWSNATKLSLDTLSHSHTIHTPCPCNWHYLTHTINTHTFPENFEDIRFYEIIGNADQDTHNSAYLKKLTKQLEIDAAAASSSSGGGGLRRGNSSLVSSIQMSGGGGGGGPSSLETAASGFGMNSLKVCPCAITHHPFNQHITTQANTYLNR